ncbi:MAG: bile acid:sodium symporter family protein [Rhodobacter sp.]|uniref:bile acid:sodium symporter family protein n=1 Tax=Pararhodobacter sp. TaxID=2127056 RepID=UPI001D956AD8|nr:bile acid:sodium symporter family protein [Pararhodobacter sp.]MCB1344288.1 bile acid:sodium symporter family protein [Paracoccaceae bacterium]MCC0073393.1 bile acid:sodium symporter family protein [Rhodobacter sp.]HPD92854.1 bile acid:sodium symporter family protein [Pararhodobacter sp.]
MSGDIDSVMLNFSPGSLMLLNGILAVVMFAIALDLKLEHFRALIRAPRPVIAGFLSQFLVLPAATYLLVLAMQPRPSIALGLILVAACPGGNISNFLTHRAGGNTALSVSLTAIATVGALVLTPLNIALWGGLYAPTRAILHATRIDPVQVAVTVAFLLVLPLALGMLVNARAPAWAARIRRPMQILSMVIFVGFIAAALAANWQYFLDLAGLVAGLVIAHNTLALALGFLVALAFRVSPADRRAITIETGIQNSGLGLILIFAFFGGLGGMAVVAAFWGMWHAVSGLLLATLWSRRPA